MAAMVTPTLTFECPAKVNLALSVGSPRADGYHPISSWMVRVSLFDDLYLAPLDDAEAPSDYDIAWAADAPVPSRIDWPLEQDLAVRAHRLIEQHVGRSLPVQAQLRKRIPVGAGLGGGSSNGVTMLRAVNDMFSLDIRDDQLHELARQMGSDLAFFLGEPSAVVGGVGEQLTAAPLHRPMDLVLILPALQCNTGAVYRRFDELKPDAKVDEQAVQRAAEASVASEDLLFNDLAEAALDVEPQLRDVHFWCEEAIDRRVHVTGSGAGLFALAETTEEAYQLAEQLRREARVAALPVRTLE